MALQTTGNKLLQTAQERDEIRFFLTRQLDAEYKIEELDRIVESQQAAVVQVRRRILDAPQRKGLDRPIG